MFQSHPRNKNQLFPALTTFLSPKDKAISLIYFRLTWEHAFTLHCLSNRVSTCIHFHFRDWTKFIHVYVYFLLNNHCILRSQVSITFVRNIVQLVRFETNNSIFQIIENYFSWTRSRTWYSTPVTWIFMVFIFSNYRIKEPRFMLRYLLKEVRM